MAVTTQLTWKQEKYLQNYFDGRQFSLLYKASVHGFNESSLLQKCYDQGPTITVFYFHDSVFGAYIQESYQKINRGSVILFMFQKTIISIFEELLFKRFTKKNSIKRKDIVASGRLQEDDKYSFQDCEVFRCEDLLDGRKINGLTEFKKNLLYDIETYNPCGGLVCPARILFLGPSRTGKSSFINSVKSVFRGRVTNQAVMSLSANQVSAFSEFRTYSVKNGKDGSHLPFILCDSLGLREKEEGLCIDDIFYILKGHVPDRYEFNSTKSITLDHLNYIDSPLLKDRIHCVVFLLDCNSINKLSHSMVTKIQQFRREVIKYGVVQMVLLTHVDELELITKADLLDPYRCMPVKLKLEEVHKVLGFPLSNILVVSNYTFEWELDLIKDVMILSALKQMLSATDGLEDLSPEEKTSRHN
ncbi:PREDICTED: interferon-induced protein 44 [Elephantulus edwardii]|uniref:interferon-induced protein 44 n=1 Tax=Elephantulus edwardii TaxID=28737 RepID=UPI0003F0A39C|nr:PREDICTED: interferon-induced protein 44 [Elephantulus edwardii]